MYISNMKHLLTSKLIDQSVSLYKLIEPVYDYTNVLLDKLLNSLLIVLYKWKQYDVYFQFVLNNLVHQCSLYNHNID